MSTMLPSVVAVMLANGREQMVRRAVASFRSQTYPAKRLLIWDTSTDLVCCDQLEHEGVYHIPAEPSATIGELRNAANGFWTAYPILIHWDSDDWSHPRRIEEQVALLQASGKECVGYRDMLFWNETACQFCGAWLYTNGNTKYCLGTSLCYKRSVWERRPFEDLPKGPTGEGEDSRWLREVDSLGVTSETEPHVRPYGNDIDEGQRWPRMIASVHGDNTSSMVELAIRRGASEMKRVPQWDSYCRERMAL